MDLERLLGIRHSGVCRGKRSCVWPRQPGIGTTVWRAELVSCGLASDDIELRDAALQAAESWRDPGLRQILAAHSEPVSWLDEYRRGIIGDLDR